MSDLHPLHTDPRWRLHDRRLEHGTDWQPGDPLHSPPRGGMNGGQYVRPLFSVLNDLAGDYALRYCTGRCQRCDVGWSVAKGGDRCWSCGGPNTHTMTEELA